jgi:cytochrome P450
VFIAFSSTPVPVFFFLFFLLYSFAWNHFTDSFRLVLVSIQVLTHVTVSMRRKALDDIKLHDGLEIPKGAFICVSIHQMWDPTIYPEPEKFDGYRFLKRSQIQGHEKDSQFSAPSMDHMGFGYGKLACPGRFFAVDVIKVLLCHMLLKYEWKLPEGYKPVVLEAGIRLVVDPAAKLLIRRRQEEIPI